MAALVQADRRECGLAPRGTGPPDGGARREGLLCLPEGQPLPSPALAQPVGDELASKGANERHPPAPGSALRLDRARLGVPAALHADHPALEVDVLEAKRL